MKSRFLKWGAYFRWSSPLYYPTLIADQMTIVNSPHFIISSVSLHEYIMYVSKPTLRNDSTCVPIFFYNFLKNIFCIIRIDQIFCINKQFISSVNEWLWECSCIKSLTFQGYTYRETHVLWSMNPDATLEQIDYLEIPRLDIFSISCKRFWWTAWISRIFENIDLIFAASISRFKGLFRFSARTTKQWLKAGINFAVNHQINVNQVPVLG